MDMYQLHFEPPDMHSIMASVGRVLFWGTAGAIQMKYMKERLREKEQGLEVDDQWEETMRANEEYGEDDTYVCTLCDNENEVRVTRHVGVVDPYCAKAIAMIF